jgi:hypothetical protein
MSFEPTEEQRAAYSRVRDLDPESIMVVLAELAQQAMAAWLKAINPHQDFDDSHWLKLADEKLREVKR